MRPEALARTRESWHRLAEHVLAAGQFAAAGTIRLRPSPGGFRTAVGVDGRDLAVAGDRLVVASDGESRSAALTTLGAAAAFAGVDLGLTGSYPPATMTDAEAMLEVDPAAARLLAGWFELGDLALRRFTEGLGAPQQPVLWPEHFDVAVTVDAVDYGCSPGDDAIPEPYLYVGPHEAPASGDPFWNAPFGAAATADRVADADAAVAFFEKGRRLTGRAG
jgi:hypothetical protein